MTAQPRRLPLATDLAGITAAIGDLGMPGEGHTIERFATLAEVSAVDLSLGRLFEGHADALAILAEAGRGTRDGTWGVWAAEPASLRAKPENRRWRLQGRKPWCSGATTLSHALCTASTDDGPCVFIVELADPGVTAVPGTWPAVGMAASDSLDVDFDLSVAPEARIGGPGWYTDRPGFWFGSIGVAACWLGGAVGAVRALADHLRDGDGDEHQLANLGSAAARCAALALAVEGAGRWIDTASTDTSAARRLALQIRHVAEETALKVLADIGRGGGAGHLTRDPAQARRATDLAVYVRQHRPGRDAAALGRAMVGEGSL